MNKEFKMKNKIILSAVLVLCGNVFAQTTYPGLSYPQPIINDAKQVHATPLNDLLSSKITSSAEAKATEGVSEMRKQALEEIASALGSTSGLAFRMKEIRDDVEKNSDKLDRYFDFKQVIFTNGILAPVITEGKANYSQVSDDEVRIADIVYKIEQPAKFVSVYPTWRTYLNFSFPSFESPSPAYLPKNDAEKVVWDNAVKQGWAMGMSQADNIFRASYSKLERDYLGMLKFHILLAQDLVTAPMIAKANLGVTGGGNEMSINDQVFRITDHAGLDPTRSDWKVNYPVTDYKTVAPLK
jgi:defect in organelle trafficking protein DotC